MMSGFGGIILVISVIVTSGGVVEGRRCAPCSTLVVKDSGGSGEAGMRLVSRCKEIEPYDCDRGVVRDGCDCCDVCGKDIGEQCSGSWNQFRFGRCGRGLACHVEVEVLPGSSLERLQGKCADVTY